MPEAKTERKKLTVTQVQEPKPVGDKGAVKLPFKAKDTEGKELAYFTFTKSIFEFIKQEAMIEADVEVSTREHEGNTYTDRKVTMIYQDGKPVAESKGGYSGKGSGYSVEAERIKQESMAASYAKDLWIAGKIPDTDPLIASLRQWLIEKLGLKPATQGNPQPAPAKPSVVSAGKPDVATKPFDLKEFTATQAILAEQGMTKWIYNNLLIRLSDITGLQLKTVAAGLMKLTDEQRDGLVKELNEDFKAQ